MVWKTVVLALYSDILTMVSSRMDSFVVGGFDTEVDRYPHVANLIISCYTFEKQIDHYACGSSIINQYFLLTAAHCYEDCILKKTETEVSVGSTSSRNTTNKVYRHLVHKHFDGDIMDHDICVLLLEAPLKLGPKVKRVLIMKNPPDDRIAEVSGWGLVEENKQQKSESLKTAFQKILPQEDCQQLLTIMPRRTICTEGPAGFAAEGDSGSALVVRDFIQVGIVSFKMTKLVKNITVYTDVSYYYNWIYRIINHFCDTITLKPKEKEMRVDLLNINDASSKSL